MKASIKKIPAILSLAAFTAVLTFVSPNSAGAWSKAGVTQNKSIDSAGIFSDLNMIVNLVIALGGFWVIIMLIIGGMLLSGSNGNPQRRTAGLVSLATSFGGGWVIIKAHDIAGWIASFGA
ncbi:pilin [Ferdinandcohnia sp. SAFN-114]|uniref:pilin n=1 Tax=Ferdinandcohnia sp. SAFN-114 TaxID=3387275 RepID=UPI003F7EB172